ncbi:MAG: RNA-binding cell elongation regulator Jag/EloR [Acidimicrobiales bacterium]
MEWVEKTGKSIEEAKERALEQLGVSEQDAELVVLAEPKTGLFGRVRSDARVRARVRPAEPRPKRQRRQKERRSGDERGGSRRQAGRAEDTEDARAGSSHSGDARGGQPASTTGGTVAGSGSSSRRRRRRGGRGRRRPGGAGERPTDGDQGASGAEPKPKTNGSGRMRQTVAAKEEDTVADDITLEQQGAVAKEFLEGLIGRYGLEASIDVRELDEETIELSAKGDGLGVLVGPKGATLSAIQDVTRTVVQRHFPNKTDRIIVDVAGYRERRAAALRRFSSEVAAEVIESGTERALEPMSPADRKVVHDAVAEIEGVSSSSEGEEPRRYVVVSPAD